jgi:hypothetical protein
MQAGTVFLVECVRNWVEIVGVIALGHVWGPYVNNV